ncbi:MAG: SIS domain-containing protein [Alphaproteobacteria bacterium]|nr:SIS domain-containing protein [Alphaproteobacteria bacterium]
MLREVADRSILGIEDLKRNVDAGALHQAIQMLDQARSIHVVGYRPASWVAAYLFYGLTQLGCRCFRIDLPADAAQRHIALLETEDLLVAVCLSDDDDSAVRVASAARKRRIPVLAFAHSADHPLAVASDLFISFPEYPERRLQPWAPHITFAQALLAALEARRAERS